MTRPQGKSQTTNDPSKSQKPYNPDSLCTATANSTGKRCTRPAVKGATVCRFHGGAAPQVIAAAGRRLAIEEMRSLALARGSFGYGNDLEISPQEAIKQELHRTAASVQWLSMIVADLDRDRITQGVTKIENRQGFQAGRSTTIEARPSVWYEMWIKERGHMAKVAQIAHTMGIDERQTQVIESAAALGVIAISRILERLELDPSQREKASIVVPEVLRSISATVDLAPDSEGTPA